MGVLLRRVWSLVQPYRSRLVLGLVCGFLFAGANAVLLVAVNIVVNLIFGASATASLSDQLKNVPGFARPLLERLIASLPDLQSPDSRLGTTLAILTIPAIMFARGLFSYLNTYLMMWVGIRAVADLRTRLFNHLLNLSLKFFNQAKTGDLISRISNDTQVMQTIISGTLSSIVKDPITVLAMLTMLLWQQPRLTMISALVFPVVIVPIIVYGRKVRRSIHAAQTHTAELTTLMHESFTGNRIIKAYNLEGTVLGQFVKTTGQFVSQMMRAVRAYELPRHLTEFFSSVGIALVFLYVASLKDKDITPGDMLQFIGAIFFMYQPIKSISGMYSQLKQAEAASQKVFELLETPRTVLDPAQPVSLRAAGADIQFDKIDFDYGEKVVLRNINFTVKAGQLVALVGSSGSGKTTITNLLLRFYDPINGAVRIGGTDICHVAVRDLRDHIALVAQETILFNETIRQNIALGRPGATHAEIEAAARHAFAHDFIMEKPQGYDTIVGEKGVALSGGQRQRIAIARAILRNAPILVLDEAMSALDTESERIVQAALEGLMQGRTTICIAHRLSTVINADLIVVLDAGRIVETGTHAELIERGGVYRKLYELQFQG